METDDGARYWPGYYFVTISPRLRLANKQFHIFYDDLQIIKLVRRASNHFIIYPEYDDKGRLHYHGIINITDYIKWDKQVLPTWRNRLGFVDVKRIKNTIKDKLNVVYYIRKNWMVTKEVLDINDPFYPKKPKKNIYQPPNNDLDEGILGYFKINRTLNKVCSLK